MVSGSLRGRTRSSNPTAPPDDGTLVPWPRRAPAYRVPLPATRRRPYVPWTECLPSRGLRALDPRVTPPPSGVYPVSQHGDDDLAPRVAVLQVAQAGGR